LSVPVLISSRFEDARRLDDEPRFADERRFVDEPRLDDAEERLVDELRRAAMKPPGCPVAVQIGGQGESMRGVNSRDFQGKTRVKGARGQKF
jgi:hypothetical protein